MSKNQVLPVSLVAGVALACFASPASAAVETFSAPYGSSSAPLAVDGPGSPADVTLPQFDPSLGNLTDIIITLDTTGILRSEVLNIGQARTFTDATAMGTIAVSGPEGAEVMLTLATTPISGVIPAGRFVSRTLLQGPAASLTGTGLAHVPPSYFVAYEHLGGGNINFPINTTFSGSYAGNGPSGMLFGGDASVFGSIEIDYLYCAVPEPGTLWTGLGLLAYCACVLRPHASCRRTHSCPLRAT